MQFIILKVSGETNEEGMKILQKIYNMVLFQKNDSQKFFDKSSSLIIKLKYV